MQDLKSLINKRYQNTNILVFAEKAMVIKAVKKWLLEQFGEIVKKQVKNIYVKNGVLTLLCASPIMSQELRLRSKQLIGEVNRTLGKTIIEDVKFN